MMRVALPLFAVIACGAVTTARAEIKDSSPSGFTIENSQLADFLTEPK